MTEQPDWLYVGAKVAAICTDPRHRSVERSTVTKVLKRDIVLANGDRYSTRNRARHVGGTWGYTVTLKAVDDPAVMELLTSIEAARVLADARDACYRFRYNHLDENASTRAKDVILALAPLTDKREEIEALFTDTPSD